MTNHSKGKKSVSGEISSHFVEIEKKLKKYTLHSFNEKANVLQYIDDFVLKDSIKSTEEDKYRQNTNNLLRNVSVLEEKPFEPEYSDLCRLHYIVLTRKAISILEFGSGYSTAIMASALKLLHHHFSSWVTNNLRNSKPFHIYSIEEDQRFLEISRRRLSDSISQFATISRSSVKLSTHDNRFVTFFSNLPNITPDIIYVDGPSQYAVTDEIDGFSINSPGRMPMSADILRFEFFLEPGALIIIDGRSANARFLQSYLQRKWAYAHLIESDLHLFELQEDPLGVLNKNKLEFCLNRKWIL